MCVAGSPLHGGPIHVIAAGGIFDGRGLAMALALGASGVWVGTRFVAATEAGAPPRHQRAVVEADYDSTIRTIIFTGRPMRVRKNDMILNWEENRQDEIRELTGKGILPMMQQGKEDAEKDGDLSFSEQMDRMPLLMGQAAGAITEVQSAKEIMDEMISGAISTLRETTASFVAVDENASARL